MRKKNKDVIKISTIIDHKLHSTKQSSRKFNDIYAFASWIAEQLGDKRNIKIYLRLVKYQDKSLLIRALSYVQDYPNLVEKDKYKIFFWYLKGKLKKYSTNINNTQKTKLNKKNQKQLINTKNQQRYIKQASNNRNILPGDPSISLF